MLGHSRHPFSFGRLLFFLWDKGTQSSFQTKFFLKDIQYVNQRKPFIFCYQLHKEQENTIKCLYKAGMFQQMPQLHIRNYRGRSNTIVTNDG